MAWTKTYTKRKATTAQQLARYKRKQVAARKKQEAASKTRQEAEAPGGALNPLTPKWCDFGKYETIGLTSDQRRYHGTTSITAFKKGTEPAEFHCMMQGHVKKITPTEHDWKCWMSHTNNVQFGKTWYRHPITSVSFEAFCKQYTVVERFNRYLG